MPLVESFVSILKGRGDCRVEYSDFVPIQDLYGCFVKMVGDQVGAGFPGLGADVAKAGASPVLVDGLLALLDFSLRKIGHQHGPFEYHPGRGEAARRPSDDDNVLELSGDHVGHDLLIALLPQELVSQNDPLFPIFHEGKPLPIETWMQALLASVGDDYVLALEELGLLVWADCCSDLDFLALQVLDLPNFVLRIEDLLLVGLIDSMQKMVPAVVQERTNQAERHHVRPVLLQLHVDL